MIKNESQLARAKKQIEAYRSELKDLHDTHDGSPPLYLLIQIEHEQHSLEQQVADYESLRHLSLADSIHGPLSSPVALERINEILAKLRIAAGLTQEELAAKLGWEQSNLSRFEGSNNGSQTIRKISEYLDGLGVWLHVTPSLTEKRVASTTDLVTDKKVVMWHELRQPVTNPYWTIRILSDHIAETNQLGTQPDTGIVAEGWPTLRRGNLSMVNDASTAT